MFCMYVCMYICMYVYMYVFMYVCMYMYACQVQILVDHVGNPLWYSGPHLGVMADHF